MESNNLETEIEQIKERNKRVGLGQYVLCF